VAVVVDVSATLIVIVHLNMIATRIVGVVRAP
jgi:hypothetical protein